MIDMQQIDLKLSFVVIIACVNAVFFILITKHVVEEQCRVPECQGTCSCSYSNYNSFRYKTSTDFHSCSQSSAHQRVNRKRFVDLMNVVTA